MKILFLGIPCLVITDACQFETKWNKLDCGKSSIYIEFRIAKACFCLKFLVDQRLHQLLYLHRLFCRQQKTLKHAKINIDKNLKRHFMILSRLLDDMNISHRLSKKWQKGSMNFVQHKAKENNNNFWRNNFCKKSIDFDKKLC